jgi:pantothenate kinase-related protein Tda10
MKKKEVSQKIQHNPVFVIVCGGSGSGKTYMSQLIKNNLPEDYTCEVISLDNFYYPKEKRILANFDVPDAID